MTKILYFFPGNPLKKTAGNNARAWMLLNYFKQEKITLDFVSEQNEDFTKDTCSEIKNQKLANNVFLLEKQNNKGISYLLGHSLCNKIKKQPKYLYRAQPKRIKEFNALLENNDYDFIIISYTCWMSMIRVEQLNKHTKVVLDTHDFLTSQFQNTKNFKLGGYFENEMKLLNKADIIWTISTEEKYLFSQFSDKQIDCIPHALKAEFNKSEEKTIDIVYVASENEHNIKAINWFIDNVYPLLSKELRITGIGKIVNHIPDFPNITKHSYIEDLNATYQTSKIAICPMLSGTGLKIKVIEALAHSLPVVCNEKGIDGFINKTDNGCIATNSPEYFKDAIEQLLTDNSFYESQKNKATKFFNANYNEEVIFEQINKSLSLL